MHISGEHNFTILYKTSTPVNDKNGEKKQYLLMHNSCKISTLFVVHITNIFES